MSRIAVVGAGLSGLVVARALARSHDVCVFEKSRGTGGRMATRRAGPWHFDHGAQFFTARSAAFRRFLEPLRRAGVVDVWLARFAEFRHGEQTAARRWSEDHPHYVGVPGMSAVGSVLADGLTLENSFRVEQLEQTGTGWIVVGDGKRRRGPFDWIIVSPPAAQTAGLIAAKSPLEAVARDGRMKACFALLLGLDQVPDPGFDAARVRDSEISWISANHTKPGRPGAPALVVHSTNAWAEAHIDDDPADVRRTLLDATSDIVGPAVHSATHVQVHRWRYANADKVEKPKPQVDTNNRIAICGDWLVRGRIEAAYRSARRLLDGLGDAL